MRSITCTLALLVLASCGPVSDSTDAGTDGGTKPCDGKKDCIACQSCAMEQMCVSQVAACQQSSACLGIDGCVKACASDPTCKQQCYANNPDGLTAYVTLTNCLLCTQCPSDCAGYASCS
jgi:hypothetical protein